MVNDPHTVLLTAAIKLHLMNGIFPTSRASACRSSAVPAREPAAAKMPTLLRNSAAPYGTSPTCLNPVPSHTYYSTALRHSPQARALTGVKRLSHHKIEPVPVVPLWARLALRLCAKKRPDKHIGCHRHTQRPTSSSDPLLLLLLPDHMSGSGRTAPLTCTCAYRTALLTLKSTASPTPAYH